MNQFPLAEARQAVGGRWIGPAGGGSAGGVAIDTRTARGGELFVAIAGERFDGHDFLQAAEAAGCVAAVVAEARADAARAACDLPLLAVADTTAALADLASWHRDRLGGTVLAVTGSNGKTTVKRMIDTILRNRLRGTCSPKSFNNHIGVPLTLLAAEIDDDYVICEVGTSAPGEIAALGALVRPDVAVLTSLAPAHLEGFGTIEAIADEKTSLLRFVRPGGAAVVWGDHGLLTTRATAAACDVERFGESAGCDVRVADYRSRPGGSRFRLTAEVEVELSVPGRHNALNAAAAMAAARRLGFALAESAEALGGYQGAEMRLQRVRSGKRIVINDAYNANPQSMVAAAAVLAEQPGSRRVLVAGDMRELGPRGRELHAETGRAIAAAGVEVVVGVGELGSELARAAGSAGVEAHAFRTVESAAAGLPGLLGQGDVVRLKGSRSMGMERLLGPAGASPTDSAAEGPA